MPPRKKVRTLLSSCLESVGKLVANLAARAASLEDAAVAEHIMALRDHVFGGLPSSLANPVAQTIVVELERQSGPFCQHLSDDRYFRFVLVTCHPKVRVLDFSDVRMRNMSRLVQAFVSNLPTTWLEVLDLGRHTIQWHHIDKGELFSKLKQMKKIRLESFGCGIKELSENCTKLEHVTLLSNQDPEDYFLDFLASGCKHLVEVNIQECARIPADGLVNMLQRLPALKILKHSWKTYELDHLRNVFTEGQRFQLENLDLSWASDIQSQHLEFLVSVFPRLCQVIVGRRGIRNQQETKLPLSPLKVSNKLNVKTLDFSFRLWSVFQNLKFLEELQVNNTSYMSNEELTDLLTSPIASQLTTLALLGIYDLDPVDPLIKIGRHCTKLEGLLLKQCTFRPCSHPRSEPPSAIRKLETLDKFEITDCRDAGDSATAEFIRNSLCRLSKNIKHFVMGLIEDRVLPELLTSGALAKVESVIFFSRPEAAYKAAVAHLFIDHCPLLRRLDVDLLHPAGSSREESREALDMLRIVRERSWDLDLSSTKFVKIGWDEFFLSDF